MPRFYAYLRNEATAIAAASPSERESLDKLGNGIKKRGDIVQIQVLLDHAKIPFKWISTWTDGRTVFELQSAQINSAVDAAKFAKPVAPKPVPPVR